MTTAAQIVSRALRLIQIIDPSQPVQANDMQTGIDALNAMLRRWEANGLALGWQDVVSNQDVLQVPPESIEAIAYNLAVRLAPEYGTEPTTVVFRGAVSFLNDLMRDQMVATPIQPILDVPQPDWWGARYLRSSVFDR